MPGRGRRKDLPQQNDAEKTPTQTGVPSQLNVHKYVEEIIIQVTIAPRTNGVLTLSQQQTIPTDADLQRRAVLLAKLSTLVRKGLAGHKQLELLPFGSCVIGLDTPSSDLDLTLNGTLELGNTSSGATVRCEARDLDNSERVKLLRALRGRVRIDSDLTERGFVPWARVPVLKFTYQENPQCVEAVLGVVEVVLRCVEVVAWRQI